MRANNYIRRFVNHCSGQIQFPPLRHAVRWPVYDGARCWHDRQLAL